MNYQPQEIEIAVSGENGEQGVIKQEAMVAVDTGLAYLPWGCEQQGMQVIHVPSGKRVGGDWLADDEEEAKIWIRNLHRIMDWTSLKPTVRAGEKGTVTWLAIIGALQQHDIPE